MRLCFPLFPKGSTVAESRVLPLSMYIPRTAAMLLAIAIVLALPLSACATPSESPGSELVPVEARMQGKLPGSQSECSSDSKLGRLLPTDHVIPAWADLTILAGKEPGPVLLVVAGVHGDEVSGPIAARQLASGPLPARGSLVILPCASPEALAADQRWLPGWSDLNRAFPDAGSGGTSGIQALRGAGKTVGTAGSAAAERTKESNQPIESPYAASDPTYLRADEILALIVSIKPDLVLDLHESDQYWTEGDSPALVVPASEDSTKSTRSAELALALLESPGMEGFAFTGPPPAGSLVAAVDGLLGIPALLVETPDALAVDDRIVVQLAVVHMAIRILGMGCLQTSCNATCCQETGCQAATGTVPLSIESP